MCKFNSGNYGLSLVGPRNKNIDSLTLLTPSYNIVNLSTPIAKPPCGGHPYLKKSK